MAQQLMDCLTAAKALCAKCRSVKSWSGCQRPCSSCHCNSHESILTERCAPRRFIIDSRVRSNCTAEAVGTALHFPHAKSLPPTIHPVYERPRRALASQTKPDSHAMNARPKANGAADQATPTFAWIQKVNAKHATACGRHDQLCPSLQCSLCMHQSSTIKPNAGKTAPVLGSNSRAS